MNDEQNDPWQNDSGEKRLNPRRRILIFGSTIILVPILFFAIGYVIEINNHHKTLLAIGSYHQACADTDSTVELAGVLRSIQGNTTRTVTEYKDGTHYYDYVWKVFGVIETNKKLFFKVDMNSQLGQVVLLVSQEPISRGH